MLARTRACLLILAATCTIWSIFPDVAKAPLWLYPSSVPVISVASSAEMSLSGLVSGSPYGLNLGFRSWNVEGLEVFWICPPEAAVGDWCPFETADREMQS